MEPVQASLADTVLRTLGATQLPQDSAPLLPAQLPPPADIARNRCHAAGFKCRHCGRYTSLGLACSG